MIEGIVPNCRRLLASPPKGRSSGRPQGGYAGGHGGRSHPHTSLRRPNQIIRITATSRTLTDRALLSWAVFRADGLGNVDLSTAKPMEGTYANADPIQAARAVDDPAGGCSRARRQRSRDAQNRSIICLRRRVIARCKKSWTRRQAGTSTAWLFQSRSRHNTVGRVGGRIG